MSYDTGASARRQLSEYGMRQLEEMEGFKSRPSLDCKDGSAGYSVGFGINSQGQPALFQEMEDHIKRVGRGLTKEEAQVYTRKALKEYEQSVRNLPNSEKLNQFQFATLVWYGCPRIVER